MGGSSARASIRWASWFGDLDLGLTFPAGWSVEMVNPQDGADIGDTGIRQAMTAPIGAPTIDALASGRSSACVVVDDLSRPTPTGRLLPYIAEQLNEAGIADESILVLGGIANHRPLMRQDLLIKVGAENLERFEYRNHFSYEECVNVGVTSRGTPVALNRHFIEADVKILLGSVVPHPVAGFAGGAKLVLPGVASIETAAAFHGATGPATGLGDIPPARLDVEDAARLAGVDCIVNVIPNSRRGIAAMVVGDVVEAHRRGVELARAIFATDPPVDLDVCVLSAYPKDNEFLQWFTALNAWQTARRPLVHAGGTVVVATASSEGPGFHSLAGPGMRLDVSVRNFAESVAPCDLVVFAPGIKPSDLPGTGLPGHPILLSSWELVEEFLAKKHGPAAKVGVFPCASMQMCD